MVAQVRRWLLGAASLALPGVAHAAFDPTNAHCADVMPSAAAPAVTRALLPEDLARLRDIGPADPNQQSNGIFTLSPDGSRAAFQIRRADPQSNSYCLAMVVVDLATGHARVVDQGGDAIRVLLDYRGRAGFPTGAAAPITPHWSPDGKWIAYRRSDAGVIQLWRAMADGSGSAALTQGKDDVEDFRLSSDGRAIVYSAVTGMRPARAALEKEGRSGFHYDERFAPATGSRPWPSPPIARTAFSIELDNRQLRQASAQEVTLLGTVDVDASQSSKVDGPGGTASILVPPDTIDGVSGQLALRSNGHTETCPDPACATASYPWWSSGGTIRFRRREGWANASTAIYEWTPGTARARRLFVTDDLLVSCVPNADALICLREGTVQPRRLERLDPASGTAKLLFDPNPEFAQLSLGRVERLRARNSFGVESFADLVLPVGYVPGTRYPLIVVQYESRGFLRGGTGDDYPIQAFASRGFAVLSINKPKSLGLLHTRDIIEAEKINLKDFADRRSVLESLEIAVRSTIDRGIADPQRVGITGLSDGASTATFALLHSNLFSAVAMSNCCFDTTMPMRVGPLAARRFYQMGYPRLTDDSPSARQFWSKVAISPNAGRIRTPILLQLPEHELLSALQSYTALTEAGAPVDLYVFPDEYHVKWQPAHRLALYQRALDWFDFWFNEKRVLAPDRAAELPRWEAFRQARAASAAQAPADATATR